MAPEHATFPVGLSPTPSDRARLRPRARSLSLERRLIRSLLRSQADPPVRVVLWDGTAVQTSKAPSVADIVIRSRGTLLRLLADLHLAFGDAYSEGRIEIVGDLVRCLEASYNPSARPPWPTRAFERLRAALPRSNTPRRSRDNIHWHYDIGNEFYELWLDERMLYTCAYFAQPDMTLEQAQLAKLDHVCRKLRLKPGEHVVEAGCGWGSLSLHMAQQYGVKVRAYNISAEQVRHARLQARRLNLSDCVEFVEEDYRNISGNYDVFASVGMLEHVGKPDYRTLGGVIDRVLRPGGRGLIHSIGRTQAAPMDRWIERRIFPGAYPPTLSEMMEVLEPYGLAVLDVENLRPHYALTLEHWLERFERRSDRVREMFDDRFLRAWRLYLAGSVAAFRMGAMELFQVVFTRRRGGEFPWTRADLYPGDRAAD